MTKLLWGQVGGRRFEAGVDQAALYLTSGEVIPWTGLISIEENFGDSTTNPIYYDGIKTGDTQVPGDFSATLKVMSYPKALLNLVGVKEIDTGLFVDCQQPKPFNLCYRSLVGNDLNGLEHGYKLHLLYNLTAITDNLTYATLSNETKPVEIGISLYGVPDKAPGYRPTAHVILDSTLMAPDIFESLETILYGDDTNDPRFPTIDELVQFVLFFQPKLIIPNQITGYSELVDGYGDITQTNVQGIYFGLPSNRLVPADVYGYYWLERPTTPSVEFWFDAEGGLVGNPVTINDQFVDKFTSLKPNTIKYSSDGKDSSTGLSLDETTNIGYVQWTKDIFESKAVVGFWFKPKTIPSVDVCLSDFVREINVDGGTSESSSGNTIDGGFYNSIGTDSIDGGTLDIFYSSLGGLVLTSTGRIKIFDGVTTLTSGQSSILNLNVWYWISFALDIDLNSLSFKIYDSDGVLVHDSGSISILPKFTSMNSVRLMQINSSTLKSSWDMLQYNPGSNLLLNPWLVI